MAKQNKHLDHLEDRIILEGSRGGKESIELLKKMISFLNGKMGSGIAVTTKWDGAPAVICGIDPGDGRFFVGTKSVFAKDAKICKTQEDIQRFYNGQLAAKLSAALRYLPSSVRSGILQGDLMFTDDKKRERIDGTRYITFRPNTITYAADPETELGKLIDAAKIGIVFHTKYTGSSMSDLTASFNVTPSDFSTGGQVWAERAEFRDITGVATLSGPEMATYEACIRRAEGSLTQARRTLDLIQTGKKSLEFDTEFLKFFNNYVKQGRSIPSVATAYNDFQMHLRSEFEKVVKKYKTDDPKDKKVAKFVNMMNFMEENKRGFEMVIATYMNLQMCKNILVEKLKRVSSLNLFVNMGESRYEATTPEGFVAIVNDKATKLIDRLEFSKLNFTVPKQWG